MWRRFGRGWLRSPINFLPPLRSKVEKFRPQWFNNHVRTSVRDCLQRFYNSYNLLSKIRAFCRYTTVSCANRCSLNRLSTCLSSKILQSIPYKSTLITMLINNRLFAIDNRFSMYMGTIIFTF